MGKELRCIAHPCYRYNPWSIFGKPFRASFSFSKSAGRTNQSTTDCTDHSDGERTPLHCPSVLSVQSVVNLRQAVPSVLLILQVRGPHKPKHHGLHGSLGWGKNSAALPIRVIGAIRGRFSASRSDRPSLWRRFLLIY